MTTLPLDTRYALERPVGAGGYCEVWRATDTVLGRPVAVKMLHPGYAQQPEALARFKAEALHAGALSHQNIARVYDYREPDGGPPYLVMEMVEGPTLAEVLGRGALGAVRTMDVVAQVAAGLQAAHSVGLVHRDITPANILFAPDGTVKITDFGIAHAVGSIPLTATGTVLGTPGYIAPERVCGYQTGPASDLYALGIVAYECLTGARPFVGPPLEVAIAHRDRPLPALPASVPGEVAALVMMLTAKDPAWRPSSAGEVADRAARLREALAAGPLAAGSLAGPAPTAVEDSRRFAPADVPSRPGIRRALVLAAAGAAAIIGLVVLSVMITSGSHSPAVQPSVSQPSATPSSGARPSGSAAPSRSSSATRPASARSSAGAAASPDPATSPAASSAASQPGPRQHKTGHGHGHGHGHG